jgi:alginate O-acetyltransferase complex protein AlgI
LRESGGRHVSFNSLTFLVFFAVVLGLHRLPLPWTVKKFNLCVASFLFYSAWNPPVVALLWITILVHWFAGRGIGGAKTPGGRRIWLFVSLVVGLGLLAFFKYANFLLDTFISLLAGAGIVYHAPRLDIVLPIGISFYTFQALTYTIDIYRQKMRPWPSLLDFAVFVSFFPQLTSGPIARASQFLPQCAEPRVATGRQVGWGLTLLTMGLFEKVLLADGILGPFADSIFHAAGEASFRDAWLGTLAYSVQLFYDFAGYSFSAIGVALCLGFALADNFRYPYAAVGFSDFWRRWHISLSSWLRDYLYIPLGGNRHGEGRTYLNLLLTMLLGGLWHGAAWRFVAWGGLHGLYLAAERPIRVRFAERPWAARSCVQIPCALLTFGLVAIAWVFFRAPDFATAFGVIRTMLIGSPHAPLVGGLRALTVALLIAATLAGQWLLRDTPQEVAWARLPWVGRSVILAVLLTAVCLAPGDDRAFIYFQF